MTDREVLALDLHGTPVDPIAVSDEPDQVPGGSGGREAARRRRPKEGGTGQRAGDPGVAWPDADRASEDCRTGQAADAEASENQAGDDLACAAAVRAEAREQDLAFPGAGHTVPGTVAVDRDAINADRRGTHEPTQQRTSSRDALLARPVRGRPWKPTVRTDRHKCARRPS